MQSDAGPLKYDAHGTGAGRGANQGVMRAGNERVILTLLRRCPGLAKAEIARRTGLSAQTVARLTASLEADGLILRGTPSRGRIGQPSLPLSLDPGGAVFLGMKVGRRSVEMIATDFLGKIIGRRKEVYDYPDFDRVVAFAETSAGALTEALTPDLRTRVAGVGIAMPFFLWSWARHLGVDAALMANWQHRDLQAEVADRLGLPVFLQNDATAACSAEMVFGRTPLPPDTLCFYIAFFIGGGLVLGNSLYTGSTGNAAGVAPLSVPDLDGTYRPLIEQASLATLERTLLAAGHDPRQMWLDPEAWDLPQDLVAAWTDRCAHALAQAIGSIQTILDLDLVLINGWLPEALQRELTERIAEHLAQKDMTGMQVPELGMGTLGPDARALGAASLPLSQRFMEQ